MKVDNVFPWEAGYIIETLQQIQDYFKKDSGNTPEDLVEYLSSIFADRDLQQCLNYFEES